MTRLNVICEGQTEARFVQDALAPHLLPYNVYANPIPFSGGGYNNYDKLKPKIVSVLNADKEAYVTTMIDLYGLSKYPGENRDKSTTPIQKVQLIEQAIADDILSMDKLYNQKFIPYLQLHEFEALLFADPQQLEAALSLDQPIPAGYFTGISKQFSSPEHINDHPHTAPSKRILSIAPYYNKVVDGTNIINAIGLPTVRQACQHFSDWIAQLERLSNQ